MAFVSTPFLPCARTLPARQLVCRARPGVRLSAGGPGSDEGGMDASDARGNPAGQPISNEVPVTGGRRLVRSVPGADVPPPTLFAEPSAGEVGADPVGEGLGPRRGTREKRVTKAAAAQGSMGFADAWASQNRDRGGSRFDVWVIIGLLFILTPFIIMAVAIYTGVIPTGGLFD